MSSKRSRVAKLALAGALTVAILVWVFGRVDSERLWGVLARADARWLIGVALAATFMNTVQSAESFRRSLAAMGAPIRYASALTATLGNLAIFSALPAGSGNLGRVAYLNRRHDVPFERGVGGALLLLWLKLVSLLLLALVGHIAISSSVGVLFAIGASLVACVAIGLGSPKIATSALAARLPERVRPWLSALGQKPDRDRRKLALAATHAFVSVFAEIVIFACLARSLGPTLPFSALVAQFPLVVIGAKLPLTLMGIGAREALVVLLLGAYASPESLLGAALLFSAVEQILPALIGSVLTFPFLHSMMEKQRARG